MRELLRIADARSVWDDGTQCRERNNPIIVVEGLDATGMSIFLSPVALL